jgi:hypothetical protein
VTVSAFTRPSTKGVPSPFRPQEYADCAAVVLRPRCKQIAKMNGRDRLEIVADLFIFDDPADIEDGKPSETIEMVVTWGRIASLLNRAMVDGRPVAACIGQDEPTQWQTRPWTLRDLPPEIEEKLTAWLRSRNW